MNKNKNNTKYIFSLQNLIAKSMLLNIWLKVLKNNFKTQFFETLSIYPEKLPIVFANIRV